MLFVLIPLALVFLGGIIYFAISKKSGRLLRLIALAALVLITISVIVCLILIFNASQTAPPPPEPGDFMNEEPVEQSGPPWVIIIVTLLILAFLGVVIYLAVKEIRSQKKAEGAGA